MQYCQRKDRLFLAIENNDVTSFQMNFYNVNCEIKEHKCRTSVFKL